MHLRYPKFVLFLTILGPAQKAGCQLPKNSALSGFIYSILLPFCAHFTICEMPSSTSGRRDPFHVCLTYFQPEEKDLSEYLLNVIDRAQADPEL